jgi:hypothetical protein
MVVVGVVAANGAVAFGFLVAWLIGGDGVD